ncbi:hypothetical protein BH23PLA1_BH23PLA1_39130 [soil metagenome]
MDAPDNPYRSGPPQTIVIDRRSRFGCLSTLLVLVVGFGLLLAVSAIGSKGTSRTPGRLDERYVAGPITAKDKVAVVRVEGIIFDNTVEFAERQLRQAREDNQVKAVVLRVDSPGGTVSGSDKIWREVQLLKRAGKPVVVSMGGVAASGGYYVSAPADLILAEPTTTTGSIGVILELPNASELMEKIGVEFHSITAGEWKGAGSPFEPLSDRDRERFQQMVDETYQRFLRIVAQGRELTLDQAQSVAEGKVFTAEEALKNGLIDRLGYQEDAIQEAIDRSGLTKLRVVRYQKPISFPGTLFGLSSDAAVEPPFKLDEETLLRLRTPRMLMILR